MSTVTIEGIDYSIQDGEYNLNKVFQLEMVDEGHVDKGVFLANVQAYHSDSSFRTFVQECVDAGQGDKIKYAQLMLCAFGGPESVKDTVRSARAAGISSAARGGAKKDKPWEAKLMSALSAVMHDSGKRYFEENKEVLFEKCGVPNDARSDDYIELLVNSGKGNLGCKVHTVEATSKWGKEGKYSVTLAYRLDINNKTRASNKTTAAPANGAAEQQPSAK